MLLSIAKALETTGAKVRITRPSRHGRPGVTIVSVDLDRRVVEFIVEERRHAPYATDVAKMQLPAKGASMHPLLVAPFIGPAQGDAMVSAGWSWADASGNFDLRAPGLRLRQRLTRESAVRSVRQLASGAGSTAILRWLLSGARLRERIEPATLTRVGRVSQPRVSQILRALAKQGLVTHTARTYTLESVEPLLDAFVRDYKGPGGSERLTYSLDPPAEFVAKSVELFRRAGDPSGFAFSADVGPDLISSWRGPTHAIVYLRQTVPLGDLKLVDAKGREDANVILRMPADTSVFSTVTERELRSTAIPLVDVPQMIWDLRNLGGDDRQEAAGRLREWFIQHR